MIETDSPKPRRGRPPSEAPVAQEAILDAVYHLLQEGPVGDITMEGIAARAKVGKATLYKWWPNKAALILAMFHERLARDPEPVKGTQVEPIIRARVRGLIKEFNGLFGKVMADLIAEGQSDAQVLDALYQQHIAPRRAALMAEIERGKAAGEFSSDTDAALLLDSIFGGIYFRHMLRTEALTSEYGDRLVTQVLRGAGNVTGFQGR